MDFTPLSICCAFIPDTCRFVVENRNDWRLSCCRCETLRPWTRVFEFCMKSKRESGTTFSESVHLDCSSCRMTSLGDGVTTGDSDDKCSGNSRHSLPHRSAQSVLARLAACVVLIRTSVVVVVGRPASRRRTQTIPSSPPPVIGSCILILGQRHRRPTLRPFPRCKQSGRKSVRAPHVDGSTVSIA